jgi:alpha-beta hydrolase superfamily lysophospholipase
MLGDVMMVHGMCCTDAVWAQFRAFFEARGARVHTPTLSPELRTRTRPPRALRALAFDDYVGELEREALRIEAERGSKPAVIGHSMGGLLAQVLAERGLVSAAALISPSPPAGVRNLSSSVFWNAFGVGRRLGITPRAIFPERRFTDAMVFNALPVAERAAAHAAMVHESGRAFADLASYPVDESTIRVPMLTVAAGRDRLVPASVVRLTARKYERIGGEFLEYPEHAHWLYAEPGWEKPAADIHDWLSARA